MQQTPIKNLFVGRSADRVEEVGAPGEWDVLIERQFGCETGRLEDRADLPDVERDGVEPREHPRAPKHLEDSVALDPVRRDVDLLELRPRVLGLRDRAHDIGGRVGVLQRTQYWIVVPLDQEDEVLAHRSNSQGLQTRPPRAVLLIDVCGDEVVHDRWAVDLQ